ncbi:MAG: DMT family transporter [Alphaproteobacteria bacterium]
MRKTDNVRGIWLMIIGSAVLVTNDAVTKYLTEGFPVWQVLTLRHIAAVFVILLYAKYVTGWDALKVGHWPSQILRGFTFIGTTVLVTISLSLLPLATFTAIVFSGPFFVAALSVPLLGETVGWRRWAAIGIGFIGVLIIVRPGSHSFEVALLIPVITAVFSALRDIVTRKISVTEKSLGILFWSTLIVIAASLLAVPWGWNPVDLVHAGWFILCGVLNASAHFLIIEALRYGAAATVSPFRYSALLWSIIFGFLIWGHLPSIWIYAGGVFIITSGVYMIQRESKLKAEKLS